MRMVFCSHWVGSHWQPEMVKITVLEENAHIVRDAGEGMSASAASIVVDLPNRFGLNLRHVRGLPKILKYSNHI